LLQGGEWPVKTMDTEPYIDLSPRLAACGWAFEAWYITKMLAW